MNRYRYGVHEFGTPTGTYVACFFTESDAKEYADNPALTVHKLTRKERRA